MKIIFYRIILAGLVGSFLGFFSGDLGISYQQAGLFGLAFAYLVPSLLTLVFWFFQSP